MQIASTPITRPSPCPVHIPPEGAGDREFSYSSLDSFSPSLEKLASATGAALAGAVVEGVGMAGIALIHTPAGVKRAYHDLFTSEHGLLYKGSWSALGIPALAVLATPLAGVVGLGLGLYGGALGGYQQGFAQSMSDCVTGLQQFNQLVGDTITFEPRRA